MNKKVIASLFFSSLFASGCATVSQCDPAIQHDTITNAGCLFSGNYSKRQSNLELTIEEERGINESLTQIHTLLDEERRGVSRSLSSTQAQYRKLNNSLDNLIAQISNRSSGNTALEQQIEKLKIKKNKVLNNTSSSSSQKQLELNSLYTEVENLKKELGH